MRELFSNHSEPAWLSRVHSALCGNCYQIGEFGVGGITQVAPRAVSLLSVAEGGDEESTNHFSRCTLALIVCGSHFA